MEKEETLNLKAFIKMLEYLNTPGWYISAGEDYSKFHLRNKHQHALIDPNTGIDSVHHDEYDPYESLESLYNHMMQSKKGRKVIQDSVSGIVDRFFG